MLTYISTLYALYNLHFSAVSFKPKVIYGRKIFLHYQYKQESKSLLIDSFYLQKNEKVTAFTTKDGSKVFLGPFQ